MLRRRPLLRATGAAPGATPSRRRSCQSLLLTFGLPAAAALAIVANVTLLQHTLRFTGGRGGSGPSSTSSEAALAATHGSGAAALFHEALPLTGAALTSLPDRCAVAPSAVCRSSTAAEPPG